MSLDKYRTADGSNNHVQGLYLGKAGSYYARTVKPQHVPTAIPEPEALFDVLLARKGQPTQHPSKISSLLFALAAIIVDDVFQTSEQDKAITKASSYLDLSPLYGSNQDTQNTIRAFADGKLKPDTFVETGFLNRPPEVCSFNSSFRYRSLIMIVCGTPSMLQPFPQLHCRTTRSHQ